jgi:4-amino-4-deoxy-L-arabinose transferase-like glycosyltransferase
MSDELYYVACAKRLAWGFVDHPPLSLAVLAAQRALLGDSLLALRFTPALMACATAVLCALLARELGGRRTAQTLAALAAAVCPVYLGVSGFYSMNAIDPVVWAGAALLVARIANGGDRRLWLALGALLGLGLLNKISVLWLGAGLGVGLVATGERRWLATPWPWAAGLIAFVVFAPHLLWQLQHDWPTLEFVRRASEEKMVPKSPLAFVAEQLLVTNPLMVPLWIAGLVFYFRLEAGRRYRALGWIWVVVFALLIASGTSRANYLGPAYIALLAAGAVVFERAAQRRAWRWLPATAAAAFSLTAAVMAPIAFEVLPPARLAAYQRALGIEAPSGERGVETAIPYHLSLRLGWPALIDAVATALASLPPEERAQAVVLTSAFGPAAAVDFFGPARGLPEGISFHNNFWLWGTGDASGEVVIAVHASGDELRRWWRDVRPATDFECEYCAPWMQRLSVWICRDPRRPLREIWPELKNFI